MTRESSRNLMTDHEIKDQSRRTTTKVEFPVCFVVILEFSSFIWRISC